MTQRTYQRQKSAGEFSLPTSELDGAVEEVEGRAQEVARLHVVGQVQARAVEGAVVARGGAVVGARAGDGAPFVAGDAREGFLRFVQPGFAEACEGDVRLLSSIVWVKRSLSIAML